MCTATRRAAQRTTDAASTRTAATGTARCGASASKVRHALRPFSSLIAPSRDCSLAFQSSLFLLLLLLAETKASVYTDNNCDEDEDPCDCPGWSPPSDAICAAVGTIDGPSWDEYKDAECGPSIESRTTGPKYVIRNGESGLSAYSWWHRDNLWFEVASAASRGGGQIVLTNQSPVYAPVWPNDAWSGDYSGFEDEVAMYKTLTQYTLVPGLDGGASTVSFYKPWPPTGRNALDQMPGHYITLVHQTSGSNVFGLRCKEYKESVEDLLQNKKDPQEFFDLTSFNVVPALSGAAGSVSFESAAFPGSYIRYVPGSNQGPNPDYGSKHAYYKKLIVMPLNTADPNFASQASWKGETAIMPVNNQCTASTTPYLQS